MRIFDFFARLKRAWGLVKLLRTINAIYASYPGLADEGKLRLWLLNNVHRLIVFSKTTSSKIDDVVAAYAYAFVDNEETWKVTYNILRKACGLSANDAVYGSTADMIAILGQQKNCDLTGMTELILRDTSLNLTDELLGAMATGVMIAIVAQCRDVNGKR